MSTGQSTQFVADPKLKLVFPILCPKDTRTVMLLNACDTRNAAGRTGAVDRTSGAVVLEVVPLGPAATAGIRPGDVITAVNELPGEIAASVWIRSTSGAPVEADPGI